MIWGAVCLNRARTVLMRVAVGDSRNLLKKSPPVVVLLANITFDKRAGFPFYDYNVIIFQTDLLDLTDRNIRQLFGGNS